MERSRHTAVSALLSLVAAFGSGCAPAFEKLLDPKDIENEVTTNTVKVKKTRHSEPVELDFKASVIEVEDGRKKFCLCRAVAYRIAQISSQLWADRVFRSYEIERVRSGWGTDGYYGMFVGILGIPKARVVLAKGATPVKDLALKDAWYEIRFKTGPTVTFRGTDKIYVKGFLELRSRFKNGDRSASTEFLKKKKQLAQELAALPFKDKFVIE